MSTAAGARGKLRNPLQQEIQRATISESFQLSEFEVMVSLQCSFTTPRVYIHTVLWERGWVMDLMLKNNGWTSLVGDGRPARTFWEDSIKPLPLMIVHSKKRDRRVSTHRATVMSSNSRARHFFWYQRFFQVLGKNTVLKNTLAPEVWSSR